jgi:hypothetical protein
MFLSGETAIDLSLLPGQIIAAHVTCVRATNKFSTFFVHLNPVLAKKIQAFVDEYVQKSEVSILLLKIVLPNPCVYRSNLKEDIGVVSSNRIIKKMKWKDCFLISI